MLDNRPYTFDRVFRLAITIGVLYGLIRLMAHLSDVLVPFVIAFLLAYLLNPIVIWVQQRTHSRVTSVFLTLGGAAALLALIGFLLTPLVMKEVAHMGTLVKRLVEDTELAQRAAEKLPPNIWESIRQYAGEDRVRDILKQKDFWSLTTSLSRKVLPGVWGILAGTTNFLFGIIGVLVIGLYLVFLLMDYQRVKNEWKRLIPPAWREPVLEFIRDFDAAMNRYFRAQAVVAGIVGVLFALGFSLIGLPMGILLGLFIGLLNMIPYLQMVGLVPATVLALIMALETNTGVAGALGMTAAVFAVVQILQDTVIMPKIMGKVTGLSPAMILLSISIWGKLLGFLGLVIALPATCMLLAYYHRLLAETAD